MLGDGQEGVQVYFFLYGGLSVDQSCFSLEVDIKFSIMVWSNGYMGVVMGKDRQIWGSLSVSLLHGSQRL
jgi:hypothetical protein